MKTFLLLLSALCMVSCVAPQPPGTAAPPGFAWKRFDSVAVEVKVPQGWHTKSTSAGGTRALQITKDRITEKGFETGLTVNFMEKATSEEFAAASVQTKAYMEQLRKSFSSLTASSYSEPQGVPTMILEGERPLPGHPERGLYHTRTIAHLFPSSRRIYILVFGSPAESWAAEYVLGQQMLNPVKFLPPQ